MTLYFAPLNHIGNSVFRHLLLKKGADYVFSEMIRVEHMDYEIENNKLDVFDEDIDRTIFQIAVANTDDLKTGVDFLHNRIKGIKEINVNMGCPHSSFKAKKICSGILYDLDFMGEICSSLHKECSSKGIIGSVKIRIGLNKKKIMLDDYMKVILESGLKKVYVHARPLKYSYLRPALYDSFAGLKKKFPQLEIILNGDVDSYNSYKVLSSYECDGIMVGRAASQNPYIFEQIKNKVEVRGGNFDPVLKDPTLVITGETKLTKKKYDVIMEFLDLAVKDNLRIHLTKSTLSNLLNGVSGSKKFIKDMYNIEDYDVLIDSYKKTFSVEKCL